jgi:nucleotide-binding universal stress UspA family protein
MVPLASILLPVDFSERSMDAARQAQVLARHFHSEVTVLHVVDPQEQESGRFERDGAKVTELETLLARGFNGASVRQIIRDGDPTRNILHFTESHDVDLIVMASHGYGPFRSFLMGSVTAEVERQAKRPVWVTAHAPQEPPLTFRTVLCAVDLTAGTDWDNIIDWAKEFAAAFMARLIAVHVIRELDSRDELYFPDDRLSQVERREIERIKQKLGKEGQVLLVGGDVSEAVCSQAKNVHADLLVIGRSPKAGSLGTARTTSFTIIRESPCPVVSI